MTRRSWIDLAKADPTASPLCEMASDRVIAAMLGLTLAEFTRQLPKLARQHFPPPDPILRTRSKREVRDWIASRNRSRTAMIPVAEPAQAH